MSILFRARRLAGLLAVLALLFSHGEAIAASSCAMMASGDMVEMAATTEGQHHCPFSPVMGPGCTAAASVRASAPELPQLSIASFEGLTAIVKRPDSASSDGLFHPPRP